MEKPQYHIKKFEGANFDDLVNLSKTYYPEGDIVNPDYLNWQYRSNPNGDPALFVAYEESTKELAAQYIVIPILYNRLGKTIKGSLSLNTLTHPKHQGKGLFTRVAGETYKYCEEQKIAFTIGFPNPNSFPGFVRKLNFHHIGDTSLLVKPLKVFKIASAVLKKNKAKHGGELGIHPTQATNIKQFDFNDQKHQSEYVTFWDKMKNQYPISTHKNFEFIKWRYSDIPTRKYTTYVYEEGGEIKGFFVLKAASVWGMNAGILMDFMVLNNDKTIGKEILTFIKVTCKNSNLDLIVGMHTPMGEIGLLKKNGFYTVPKKLVPQKMHFIVREHNSDDSDEGLKIVNNWKLTFGDYDVF